MARKVPKTIPNYKISTPTIPAYLFSRIETFSNNKTKFVSMILQSITYTEARCDTE